MAKKPSKFNSERRKWISSIKQSMEDFISQNYNPMNILSYLRKETKCYEPEDNLYFCFDGLKNLKYIYQIYKNKNQTIDFNFKYWLILVSGNRVEIVIDGYFQKKNNLTTERMEYHENIYLFSGVSVVGMWYRSKRSFINHDYISIYNGKEITHDCLDLSNIKIFLFDHIKIPHISFFGTTIQFC
jgi:hypothetical protein